MTLAGCTYKVKMNRKIDFLPRGTTRSAIRRSRSRSKNSATRNAKCTSETDIHGGET